MIDTNVILSAIINRDSIPDQVLQYVIENEEMALCKTILDECFEVANRRFPGKIGVLEKLFLKLSFTHLPDSKNARIMMPDVGDQPILNCAMENQVDILVTGDHHFLELGCEKAEILSPRDYFDEYIK